MPSLKERILSHAASGNSASAKKRSGISEIVEIAVGLILFATVGVIGIQLISTATTTSWQPVVVTIVFVVVPIFAALSVGLGFYKYIKGSI